MRGRSLRTNPVAGPSVATPFALLSNNLKGFCSGGQGDRHAREVLLETEQRHVDVLGCDLHRAANTPCPLGSHQRGAAAAKGLKHDLAFIGVRLNDLQAAREAVDFVDHNQRDTSHHRTQSEAERAARDIAINQRSEVLIHGENGRIRERNSYGNDPHPPKG